ncbi:MAG: hypothetical protein JWP09_890 [Candidatus Taylorbacteria bacterium]|nr:hypothetical protein [Candidatus Taylorbacteria bacterium]
MRKKTKKYLLLPTEIIMSENGVSMYSLVREGDFSRDLTQKYHNDVKDVLNLRLEKMMKDHSVPLTDINRVKELISELVHTKEILVTYDMEKPMIQKIMDK